MVQRIKGFTRVGVGTVPRYGRVRSTWRLVSYATVTWLGEEEKISPKKKRAGLSWTGCVLSRSRQVPGKVCY